MPLPALILAVVLACLSALHAYWALGGRWGWRDAVPTREGVPLFVPGRGLTIGLAAVLFAAAVIVLWRGRWPGIGPSWLPRYGVWALCGVFGARAVGDFRYCGFFKRARNTPFARKDSFLYSPLCAALSALALWLSLGY